MRILFLAPDIQLGLNRGDSLHVRKLAAALAKAGHTVDLVVAKSGELAWAPTPRLRIAEYAGVGTLRPLLYAARLGRRTDPEIIYERRFSPKLSAGVGAALGIPFVVEINGIPDEEAALQGRPDGRGKLMGGLKEKVRGRLLRRASAVITVTPGLRTLMISRFAVDPGKAFVIPNGVDSDLFFPMDQNRARSELGLAASPIICFVGNLVQWQGIHTLLEALASMGGTPRAILVGSGPEEGRLRRQADSLGISSRVLFVGNVPHELVPKFIAASDVCVAPFTSSRNSKLGVSALKLLEYIACGRPVVASNIPGARELLSDLRCGAVTPPDSPAELAETLSKALKDQSLCEAARAASDYVRSHHSWDATAQAVGRVLSSCLPPEGDAS